MLDSALVTAKYLGKENGDSVADELFDWILAKIAQGKWPVGYTIPTEKDLIEQFGISRIAVRECMLKLRAFGILNGSRGRRTTVARIDSRQLGHLFPLILANEGKQSFEHVFQLRLMIESQAAYLAAQSRSEEQSAKMYEILQGEEALPEGDTGRWIGKDRSLHLEVAKATQNPLIPLLVEALWGFLHTLDPIIHKGCPDRRDIDDHHHRSIVEAIVLKNPDRARVEMEAHLQSSADHIRTSGVLDELEASQK